MKKTTLMLGVLLLFSVVALFSCKDDDEPKVFGVVTAKMIAGDGRSYNCVVETDRLINSADSMKMGTDLSAISLELEASMGTEMYYNNEPLTKETVLNLTEPVTIQARNGGDVKAYRVEAVVQTAQGAKVSSDMTATGLPKFASYDIVSFKGKFFCVGADHSNGTNDDSKTFYHVYSSENGENWTKVSTNPKVVGAYGCRLVVFKDQLFVLGGIRYGTDEEGNTHNLYAEPWYAMSSMDGITWKDVTENAESKPLSVVSPTVCIHNDKIVVTGGWRFVFGMLNASGCNSAWFSNDGKEWTMQQIGMNVLPTIPGAFFSYKGKLWCAGGSTANMPNAEKVSNGILTSDDDGATWTEVSANDATAGAFSPRFGNRIAEHNGILYMFGGQEYDEAGNPVLISEILRSEDGIAWTALEEDEQLKGFEGRLYPILVNGDGSLLWIFGGASECGSFGNPETMLYDAWQKVIK